MEPLRGNGEEQQAIIYLCCDSQATKTSMPKYSGGILTIETKILNNFSKSDIIPLNQAQGSDS